MDRERFLTRPEIDALSQRDREAYLRNVVAKPGDAQHHPAMKAPEISGARREFGAPSKSQGKAPGAKRESH